MAAEPPILGPVTVDLPKPGATSLVPSPTAQSSNTDSDAPSFYRLFARELKRIVKPLAAGSLAGLFLYIYLVLAQKRIGNVGGVDWFAPMRTETAFFVYAVLLAGLLGSLLKHFVLAAKATPDDKGANDPLGTATYLFVGMVAAFAATVLLPTALLVPTAAGTDPFGAVNKWGLIVLGAAVGYVSRESLSDFARSLRTMFDTAPALANIEDRVEAGLKKAIAPPPFANFRGRVAVGLQNKNGAWVAPESLNREGVENQQVVVFIGSAFGNAAPTEMTSAPVVATDGEDRPEVIFDLVVDGSSMGMRLARKSVTVATTGAPTLVRFSLTPMAGGAGLAESARASRPSQIAVLVYQGSRLCGDVKLTSAYDSKAVRGASRRRRMSLDP